MNYCSKIFGSHLRQPGIEAEIVDLLQGRVMKSIFGRHYFRPSMDQYRDRAIHALNALKKQIEQ